MRSLVVALMLMLPFPAFALSCMAPSVTRSFHQFNDAPETYVIVQGRLTLDTKKLPRNRFTDDQPPEMTLIPGRLKGKSMTAAGFSVPFDKAVTLEVACFGPWCGSVQNGEEVIAFVKRESATYSVAVNPCGGAVFGAPKPKHEKALQRCLTGGKCPKD